MIIGAWIMVSLSLAAYGAVSYTHLDVYKRQIRSILVTSG